MAKGEIKLTLQKGRGFKKCIGATENGKPAIFWLGDDRATAEALALLLQRRWIHIREPRQVRVSEGDYGEGPVSTITEGGSWTSRDIEAFKGAKARAYTEGVIRLSWADSPISVGDYLRGVEPQPRKPQALDPFPITASPAPPASQPQQAPVHVALAGPPAEIQTVAQAIAGFKQFDIQPSSRSEGWKRELSRRLDALGLVDMPLTRWAFDEINACVEHWISKVKRGESSPDTALAEIRALRLFIQWTVRTNKTDWRPAFDWRDLFSGRAKVVAGERRKTLRTTRREVTVTELATIYAHATLPRQKLYLLLGLNCGWTQVDISSLTGDMLHLGGPTPYLERTRSKTGVFGRWALWPETVSLLKAELLKNPRRKGELVLLTQDGKPVVWQGANSKTDSVALAWRRLLDRSGLAVPYKYLRKTGSQLIRNIGGMELSEAFLAHSDQTTGDHYNAFRNWSKLDAAIMEMRQVLQPMFDAAPKA